MKRILVTGGAGFIGSNYINTILSESDDFVLNIDKLTYAGNLENLHSIETKSNYRFVKGDICNSELIDYLFTKYKFTHVVNFAAESHVDRSILGSEVFFKTNVIGTNVLLEAAKRFERSVFVCKNNLDFCLQQNIVSEGTVILNGLDEDSLSHLTKEEANSYFLNNYGILFQKNFVLGSSGRLAYPKNYEFLIESYTKIKNVIPNIKLLIVGDGPDREKLQKRIDELNLNEDIFLVGSIKNFYQYIKVFDVFILPSIFEGLSISLIEAVFAGIPILTSDVGGNSEIINNDKNQLFELNNSEEFQSKLLNIRENAEKISNNNLSLRKNFRQDIMAEKYLKIYIMCINNNL